MKQSGFEEINLFQSMKVLDNVSTKKETSIFLTKFWGSNYQSPKEILTHGWGKVVPTQLRIVFISKKMLTL